MKFYDNKGNTHNTYIGSIKSSIINKIDNFVEKKMPGVKESEQLSFDDIMGVSDEAVFTANIVEDLNKDCIE